MPDDYVTRGEFTLLVGQVQSNQQRLDTIDNQGTRGVGIVQSQLMDLKGDVAGLTARMDRHEEDHKSDAKARVTSRRWLVTTLIGAFAAVGGLYALVLDVVSRIH